MSRFDAFGQLWDDNGKPVPAWNSPPLPPPERYGYVPMSTEHTAISAGTRMTLPLTAPRALMPPYLLYVTPAEDILVASWTMKGQPMLSSPLLAAHCIKNTLTGERLGFAGPALEKDTAVELVLENFMCCAMTVQATIWARPLPFRVEPVWPTIGDAL